MKVRSNSALTMIDAIAQAKKDIEKNGESNLQLVNSKIRLDHSKKGYEHRIDGPFATVEDSTVHLPYLRTIWDRTNQNSYILGIGGDDGSRGIIRKTWKSGGELGDLLGVKDLTQYVQTVSIGLGVIREWIETNGKNNYMFQNKSFSAAEKLYILKSVARTQSALAVLSEAIMRARTKNELRVSPRDLNKLLELHRLI